MHKDIPGYHDARGGVVVLLLFLSLLTIFHSYGDVTFTSEGQHILFRHILSEGQHN